MGCHTASLPEVFEVGGLMTFLNIGFVAKGAVELVDVAGQAMLGQGLSGTNVKSGVRERTICNTAMGTGAISTKSCVGIKQRGGHEVACIAGLIPPTVLSVRGTGRYGCSGRTHGVGPS